MAINLQINPGSSGYSKDVYLLETSDMYTALAGTGGALNQRTFIYADVNTKAIASAAGPHFTTNIASAKVDFNYQPYILIGLQLRRNGSASPWWNPQLIAMWAPESGYTDSVSGFLYPMGANKGQGTEAAVNAFTVRFMYAYKLDNYQYLKVPLIAGSTEECYMSEWGSGCSAGQLVQYWMPTPNLAPNGRVQKDITVDKDFFMLSYYQRQYGGSSGYWPYKVERFYESGIPANTLRFTFSNPNNVELTTNATSFIISGFILRK